MNVQLNPSMVFKTDMPTAQKPTPAEAHASFADSLKGAIENLNTIQGESDKMTEALAAGKTQDLHNVMITAQKASITLETTVQIQQKVIDAYNEVMRMQI